MPNKTTAALIALFFVALVGVWVLDTERAPSASERGRVGRLLPGLATLRPDELRRIEIEGPAEHLMFERRDGQRWQMIAPLDAAADPSLVENLALLLKELARKPQATTLTGDPAEYGLAPASRVVRLWGAGTDAPLAVLELGRISLDRRYVRAGGSNGIEVVAAQGLEVVDRPAIRWRDRELLRAPAYEVDQITVASGNVDLVLDRGVDAWRITRPIRALAEQTRVEELVAGLAALRLTDDTQFVADEVPPADEERFGLDKPSCRITLSAGRGPRRRRDQTLLVGNPVPNRVDRVYARLADQNDVVAVESRTLDRLRKLDPNTFRNPKVADINPNRAIRVRISAAGRSFDLNRAGNDWSLGAPLAGRADPKAVQEFFKALDGLKTSYYLPNTPQAIQMAGMKVPTETIEVWQMPDPRRPATTPPTAAITGSDAPHDEPAAFAIRLGRRDAATKTLYAQVEGDTSILLLPDTVVADLFRESWAFRDRLLLEVATDSIDRIRFEGPNRRVMLQAPVFRLNLNRAAAPGWWLSEPVAAPADGATVAKLLKYLGALKVDGYAADSPDNLAPFGLDRPVLRATWSIPASLPPAPLRVPLPPETDPATGSVRYDERTLLVGGVVPERTNHRYAMLAGQSTVFLLGPEALATLDAEWHGREVVRFDPAQAETIHLEWPRVAHAVDLVRTGEGWAPVGPVDLPDFPTGAAGEVVRAASTLTTPRFAQYQGDVPAGVGLLPPYLRVRFGGSRLRSPIEIAVGNPIDARRAYAMTPTELPGAVFLIDHGPFLPWLNLAVGGGVELPSNVFAPDDPPAPADPTGQPAP